MLFLCPRIYLRAALVVAALGVLPSLASAADIDEAQRLFKTGQYEQCAKLAAEAIEDGEFTETWRHLKLRSELAMGHYAQAKVSLASALKRYPNSIQIRWIGVRAQRMNGEAEAAAKALGEIEQMVKQAPWRYRDAGSRVTLGRFLLSRGADAKDVLGQIYNKIKKDLPRLPEAFVASGELALAKHDYGLAAEAFEKALKLDSEDPAIHFGLARALEPSDLQKSRQALAAALERNENYVPGLLLLVDDHVDAERYAEAEQVVARILKINRKEPAAWAYRAVLAHLDNDAEKENACRDKALSTWAENPAVDHLIGKKLSQKYRFSEGSAYQRQALAFDAKYLPAKMQLCQDLLRLGQELEGWKLADEVFKEDGYSVVAHNLTTLRDRLTKFRTLKSDGFAVRMEDREAAIYGQRVLDLLRRAKETLCKKYDVELDGTIYVEIFPRQQDFAIRTFGLPGGAGFLGVCFGRVITMNSPASQGSSPSNWEAVLWHEFAHVVTLNKTNNKMPRWLSEGISVYEERQQNAAWGQTMNPRYRKMVLDGELTPVSQLSGAFLAPKSPLHLQFAYYESSLVVEYLIEKHGLETLKRILVDLGVGMPINESIRRYAGSLDALDKAFAEYAKQRAESLAPEADFSDPELPPRVDTETLAKWNADNPDNYMGLKRYAKQLIAEKKWTQAKPPLWRLLKLYPGDTSGDNSLVMLSVVYRELNETAKERKALERLAALDADAGDVYLRLMELAAAEKDWEAVKTNAQRMLAVNPLLRAPHRHLAEAAEQTGDDARAIAGLRALLVMDPLDPADVHYRTAKLLHRTGDLPAARREVLMSLEESPRYRAAHRLLLTVLEDIKTTPAEKMP